MSFPEYTMSVTRAAGGSPEDADGNADRQGAATEHGGDLTQIGPARRVGVRFLQMYTFFAAPAKDDLYLLTTVYLVSVHGKTAGEVGSLQSLRDFGVAIGSVTAGYIIDRSRHKIEIAAVANVMSILGVIILLYTVDMGPLYFRAIITGLGCSFIGPARNTLALGLVGKDYVQSVVSKNEAFDHAGAVGFGAVMAVLAYYMYPNIKWTFLTIAVTGIMVELSLLGFHVKASKLVSHSRACDSNASGTTVPLLRVLCQRSVILYCLTVFFMHVANAPIRNLVGQVLAIGDGRASLPLASAALVVAEIFGIVGAWYYKPVCKKLGDRGMIYLGATTVAIRSMINFLLVRYMDVESPGAKALFLSTQVFDGVGHGIWVTNQMSVMHTIGAGSGHFGFLSGLAHLSHMMGATCGQLIGGILADESFETAFVVSAVVPVLSCICITGVVMDSPWTEEAHVDSKKSRSLPDEQP
jgi:hypothetical protein